MIIVEVKRYTEERGMEMLEYLEIQDDGTGDMHLGNFDVRKYTHNYVGSRVVVDRSEVKGHRRVLGALALLRRALNDWRSFKEGTAEAGRKAG